MDQVKAEIEKLRTELEGRVQEAKQALETRLADVELNRDVSEVMKTVVLAMNGNNSGGEGASSRSYMPMKSTVPKAYAGKLDEFLEWRSEAGGYVDSHKPGMGALLKWIWEQATLRPNWKDTVKGAGIAGFKDELLEESTKLWRFLKTVTEGEPKDVVKSVEDENGFEAWHQLNSYVLAQIEALKGPVLAEVNSTIRNPAKDLKEMRSKVVELDKKMKLVKDVTGVPIDANHAKSVLIGAMDGDTRRHTAEHHSESYEVLKMKVLNFANNAGVMAEESMGTEKVKQVGEREDRSFSPEEQKEWEHVAALGKGGKGGGGGCYTCGDPGHYSRECPKGKGKSKGGGKNRFVPYGQMPKGGAYTKGDGKSGGKYGKGLGKSAGPKGGCWICGGTHFQSECPANKGPGKGGSLRQLQDSSMPYGGDWEYDWGTGWDDRGSENGQIRFLTMLKTREDKNASRNKFAALEEEDDEEEEKAEDDDEEGKAEDDDEEEEAEDDIEDVEDLEGAEFPELSEVVRKEGNEDAGVIEGKTMRKRNRRRMKAINRKEWKSIRISEDCSTRKSSPGRRRGCASSLMSQQGRNQDRATEEGEEWHCGVCGDELTNSIRMLKERNGHLLNKVAETEYEEIDLFVDSGATETVLDPSSLPGVEIIEGEAMKRGVEYETADGSPLANLGEKRFCGMSAEGVSRGLISQVTDINKPLLSVRKVVKAGHRVVFDHDNSYIEDRSTGERMGLREDGGMYVLKLWVKKSGFAGRG